MSMLKEWTRSGLSAAKKMRAEGDKARDARDWKTAADSYLAYLDAVADDAGIWVQYGHALKEQGLLNDAEAAYRKALTLAPSDTDVRIHLAHILKRTDRPKQAATLFREIAEVAPTLEVIEELKALGIGVDIQNAIEKTQTKSTTLGRYLELKDLFQYLSLHTTVTGITRVTLGLINFILEEMDEQNSQAYQFVHMVGDAEGLMLLPKQKIRRLVQLAMAENPDLHAVQTLITEMRRTSGLTRLKAGDLYMIVGAFWEFEANPTWLCGMKQRGVIVGAYIYDLIPITHAHYCMAALTDAFTAAFADTSRLLDFSLTISEFVAEQVKDYLKRYNIAPFPTMAVPLAHQLRFQAEGDARSQPVSSKLDVLEDRPFVLCVCTIEARKNHIYLFYIWQRMLDAGIDVPDLVFVGRHGWRIQDLLGQIEASRNLGGRLHVMHGLSDADLTSLYDRCMFTVFPSFVEGWGLPVGESLAHGKVCVASSATSIPEVGGEFAVYIDPFNLESGYQAISQLILKPSQLAELEANVRKNFVARTWSDVGKDFFSKIDQILSKLGHSKPIYAPLLASGSLLQVQSLQNVGAGGAEYVANPRRLVFTEGWRSIEPTGTWMLERSARLRLRTDLDNGSAVTLLLHVGSSPWVTGNNTLRVMMLGDSSKGPEGKKAAPFVRSLRPDANFWIKLDAYVDETGCLPIQFRLDGSITTPDSNHAPVALRLFAIGYGASGDYVARLNLLEQVMLPSW